MADSTTIKDAAPRKRGAFNNINIFVANVFLLTLGRVALKAYLGGSIRTIERKFGFNSTATGLIFGLLDAMHIVLVLFLGYAGRSRHKPKLIAITSVFPAIATLLMAMLYFIAPDDGGAHQARNEMQPVAQNVTDLMDNASTLTFNSSAKWQMCDQFSSADDCDTASDLSKDNSLAYALFLVASLLYGVGGPAATVLAIPYVDENSVPAKTDICTGVIMSSFPLGPVFGLILAAVCTRLPENLQDTDLDPSSPQFIGAWWLGFSLIGVLILITDLLLFCYPKSMVDTSVARAEKHEKQIHKKKPREICQGTTHLVLRLLRVKEFVVVLLSEILISFMMVGLVVFSPRYLEVHFRLPAYKANVVAGTVAAVCVVGNLVGGIVPSKLRMKVTGLIKMMLLCCGVMLLGAVTVLFIKCPEIQLDGEWNDLSQRFSLETTCNRNCSCQPSKIEYSPVCGANGVTYFSPCHAGCSYEGDESFSDCSCTEDGVAESGSCVGECSAYIAFVGVAALLAFAMSVDKTIIVITVIRVIPEKDRPLALSLMSFMTNLLGMLPGPIFFGSMVDSACDLWKDTCGETGNCLLYDQEKLRLRTLAPCVAVLAVTFLLYLTLFLLARKTEYNNPHPQEEKVEGDKAGGPPTEMKPLHLTESKTEADTVLA